MGGVALQLGDTVTYLLCRCSGGGEPQGFLDVLSDGHGTEDIEEDEATVSHVVAQEVPVTQALHPVDGGKRKLGHHAPVKDRVKHREESGEGET